MSEPKRRQGAVLLGGREHSQPTADQSLLQHHRGSAWNQRDPWRVLRIQSEFVEGFGTLAELGPEGLILRQLEQVSSSITLDELEKRVPFGRFRLYDTIVARVRLCKRRNKLRCVNEPYRAHDILTDIFP